MQYIFGKNILQYNLHKYKLLQHKLPKNKLLQHILQYIAIIFIIKLVFVKNVIDTAFKNASKSQI